MCAVPTRLAGEALFGKRLALIRMWSTSMAQDTARSTVPTVAF